MTNTNPLLLPASSTPSLHSLLLYLLLLLSSTATPTLHCLDSSDCHPRQFCHFSLGSTFCLDCRNCHADFQRHRARTESGCARNGWECGACLRGYAEQKLHAGEGRVAELCVSDTGGLETTGNQTPPCVVNDGIGPVCDVVCVVGIFLVAVAVLLVALQLKIVNDRYRARRRARSSARTMSDMEEDMSADVEDGCIQSAEGSYRPAAENYRVGVENYRAGGETYRARGENYGSGSPEVDNYRYFLRFFFNNSRVPPVPPFPPPPYNENGTTAQSNSQRRQRKPF